MKKFEFDATKLAAGVASSDVAIRAEIAKQLIYHKADFISLGTKLVGVRNFSQLDAKYTYPSDAAVEYPVPEGSGSDLSLITWANFSMSLEKGEGRFQITDEATWRGVNRTQWDTCVKRISEGIANKKDSNILGVIAAGAGNTFLGNNWQTATAAQIECDLAALVAYIVMT